jgi:hypothetical protein
LGAGGYSLTCGYQLPCQAKLVCGSVVLGEAEIGALKTFNDDLKTLGEGLVRIGGDNIL